jgi:hypothetical protein
VHELQAIPASTSPPSPPPQQAPPAPLAPQTPAEVDDEAAEDSEENLILQVYTGKLKHEFTNSQCALTALTTNDLSRARTLFTSRMHVCITNDETAWVQQMRRLVCLADALLVVEYSLNAAEGEVSGGVNVVIHTYFQPSQPHPSLHASTHTMHAHLYALLTSRRLPPDECGELFTRTLRNTAVYAQRRHEHSIVKQLAQFVNF